MSTRFLRRRLPQSSYFLREVYVPNVMLWLSCRWLQESKIASIPNGLREDQPVGREIGQDLPQLGDADVLAIPVTGHLLDNFRACLTACVLQALNVLITVIALRVFGPLLWSWSMFWAAAKSTKLSKTGSTIPHWRVSDGPTFSHNYQLMVNTGRPFHSFRKDRSAPGVSASL